MVGENIPGYGLIQDGKPSKQHGEGRRCERCRYLLSRYNVNSVCGPCVDTLTEEQIEKSEKDANGSGLGPKTTFTKLALQNLLEEPPGG